VEVVVSENRLDYCDLVEGSENLSEIEEWGNGILVSPDEE
jgi:hypothetical protein